MEILSTIEKALSELAPQRRSYKIGRKGTFKAKRLMLQQQETFQDIQKFHERKDGEQN